MARLFVDNLTVMDFSFLDRERGVVGESWIVDIVLGGELDDQGMVFDFGHVKKQIKRFIDARADHRLLVPVGAEGCRTELAGEELFIEFPLASGALIRHRSPRDAVLLVQADAIDAAQFAGTLAAELEPVMPENVKEVLITLRPEAIEGAYFHYTHGLAKHRGQCQRIAHGHRSRLEIAVDGQRDAALEAEWAGRLADSYIATEAHIADEADHGGVTHLTLRYTAAQGDFTLTLPRDQVYVMPLDSTVENIAGHLADRIAGATTGDVLVKAFEGVGKGAFGSRTGR
ncbi:6-carboxytetrahydropterin synthase [Pseudohaliea sp.]|uniref:6-carboxytetrahydropterin synthase n=1 Tax=Pseudohaliea sp. TaxID=2740289 RepID=UPI0032EE20B7